MFPGTFVPGRQYPSLFFVASFLGDFLA